MATIRSGPFAWPPATNSSANPAHTVANPHLSRKRARSPSSSPEFGPDGDQLQNSTFGTRSYGYGHVNRSSSEEEDADIYGSARKRFRHALDPEQEKARRELEGMYLSDAAAGGINPATSPFPSLIIPNTTAQNSNLASTNALPTYNITSTQPDFYPHPQTINDEDGDLPIFDASIPILQAQSIHGPDSSSDREIAVPRMAGTSGQWRNIERERRVDRDADMMMEDEGLGGAGFGAGSATIAAGSRSGLGPRVEEIVDEAGDNGGLAGWPRYSSAAKGKGREKRLYSDYEPEKDRIIVTSLSDTETSPPSSPRSSFSPSPTLTTPPNFFSSPIDLSSTSLSTDDIIDLPPSTLRTTPLAQPGEKGFTISPSLLSRLNDWQSNNPDQYLAELTKRRAREKAKRELVVYRPPSTILSAGARQSKMGMMDAMDSEPDEARVELGMGARIEEIVDEGVEDAPMMDMDTDDGSAVGMGTLPGMTNEVESMDIE